MAATTAPSTKRWSGCAAGARSRARARSAAPFDQAASTVVVEFNDLPASRRALAAGDIAAVLCEPVMTNVGMVLPAPGFLAALRAATRRHGTLLVIDETHTLSSGSGGYARQVGLAADLLVCGKAIAGGLPCAVYGFTAAVEASDPRAAARAASRATPASAPRSPAIRWRSPRCMPRCELITPANHARMEALARSWRRGSRRLFERARARLAGVARRRAPEFGYGPAPRNGSEAEAAMRPRLEHALHLYLLNRGLLVTPFHNMMLASPATTEAQVDAFARARSTCLDELRCHERCALQRADHAELQAFLANGIPTIEAVQLLITDPSGVPRGKNVRAPRAGRAVRARPQRRRLDPRARCHRRRRRGHRPGLGERRRRQALPSRAGHAAALAVARAAAPAR